MSARQVRGYWSVSYRDERGKSRTRTFGKGREGKKKAEAFGLEVQYKKARGEPLPMSRAEGMYLDELCQLWIDEKKAQGRVVEWLKTWVDIFNKTFMPPLTSGPAHTITQAQVMTVVSANYANASQATRNRYIGYIKSILEYGVVHGHLQKNPLAAWKKGKERRRESLLTLDDLKKLQSMSPPHLSWTIECAWNIPCRPGPSDLFALRFGKHVDYGKGGVNVYHTKVGRWAWIPCTQAFMRKLWEHEQVHASGYVVEYRERKVGDVGKALSAAAERAKLPYALCMYDIRHLWITTMLDQGVEPSTIADMAGTSVKMIVQNYYEPRGAKDRAAALLPPLGQESAEEKKVVNIGSARKPAS